MGLFGRADVPTSLAKWIPAGARIEAPRQGCTSDVIFVEGGRRDVVLKRCGDPHYVDWLRSERRVLAALQGKELPTPRLLDEAEVESGGGRHVWIVTERLPGQPMRDVLQASDAARRAALFGSLGRMMARLHATPVPPELAGAAAWIPRMLEEAERNLAWCEGTADQLARLQRSIPTSVPETLIHGDLALDNVLVQGTEVMGLIDWPLGGTGDPRYDIALALRSERPGGPTAAELGVFEEAYGAPLPPPETLRWLVELYDFF